MERPAGLDPEITVRGDAEGVWHRVHPLTPFVRSWLLLVALVWGIGNAFVDDLVSSLVKHEPLEVNVSGAVEVVGLGLALAVLCGALGVLIALGLLSWWFIRYQITEDHVRFRSGWLFRTQRQARLDRVQGID
ncbi:PH domain-containing protein, partial [Corynebacterium xerosis]